MISHIESEIFIYVTPIVMDPIFVVFHETNTEVGPIKKILSNKYFFKCTYFSKRIIYFDVRFLELKCIYLTLFCSRYVTSWRWLLHIVFSWVSRNEYMVNVAVCCEISNIVLKEETHGSNFHYLLVNLTSPKTIQPVILAIKSLLAAIR